MIDLSDQYRLIKEEIDLAMSEVVKSGRYIGGPAVQQFENLLGSYLNVDNVISCGNGTDALQIALMALELKKGDEVIVPAFGYASVVEVVLLLGLTPVFVDIHPDTFNINADQIEQLITSKTKVIMPIHLFGLGCEMSRIMALADKYNLSVIEDNAQALGGGFDGQKFGTIGHIGCTSFFPTKHLGCFGDGGCLFTNDENLAYKIKQIASHGQSKKYIHTRIGVNSRLDALQAAILTIKLKYLDKHLSAKKLLARGYQEQLKDCHQVVIPFLDPAHTFHQYTIRVEQRGELQKYLKKHGVSSMIYYPMGLHQQKAYKEFSKQSYPVTESISKQCLSLPIYPDLHREDQLYVTRLISQFYGDAA